MRGRKTVEVPLGLPDQLHGRSTAPADRGDETQDRFSYQWAIGVMLLVEAITGNKVVSMWCEHHDDYLLEMDSGLFIAVQVKTDGSEGAVWKVRDEAFVAAIKRFCALETAHTTKLAEYHFCSNAPPFVPGKTAVDLKRISDSPERLRAVCASATCATEIADPQLSAFQSLKALTGASDECLFAVLQKLVFRRGPTLRGYQEWMLAGSIAALPGCSGVSILKLRRLFDELMRIVQTASGMPRDAADGGLSYLASNGRPEASLRGKCITVEAARTTVDQARDPAFRYVSGGSGLPLGHVTGQRDILHRKMRNAYLTGNFESIWMRALSTERRLMERALSQSEDFDGFVNQLEGVVLAECQDAEALGSAEPDPMKRGPTILREVLQRLTGLATDEPEKVEHEPKETLIGVAGMLSASCRFAWGTPLEGDNDGI
jgi:hypothetical protein